MDYSEQKHSSLMERLKAVREGTVRVVTRVPCDMRKKDNPFFRKEGRSFVPVNSVMKISERNYGFGWDYSEKVNEAADSSTDFHAKSLSYGRWHEGLEGKVLEKESGDGVKYYLRLYIIDDDTRNVRFTIDDKDATDAEKETIESFMSQHGLSKVQESLGIERERQVLPVNVGFDSILSISVNGESIYDTEHVE